MKKIIFICFSMFVGFHTLAQRDEHSKFFIKFSPTQLVVGEMNFAYEQRVSPQSSIELSLGPTVSEIGINKFYLNSIIGNMNYYGGGNSRKESGMGFFAGLVYRYYPISVYATAPQGLYLGPEVKYRMYNTYFVDNSGVLDNKIGTTNQFLFRFNTGYQFVVGRRFAIDVFTALGLGYTVITQYNNYTIFDGNYNLYKTDWTARTRNKVFFSGSIGVKFGIGGNRKDK
ncbi:MAG: DUF3575 domain-containing protein [Crocinitomicaceae bacterium]|nr:DUF3575 domain-containing protein [Crocinitomicaceae bacterium]